MDYSMIFHIYHPFVVSIAAKMFSDNTPQVDVNTPQVDVRDHFQLMELLSSSLSSIIPSSIVLSVCSNLGDEEISPSAITRRISEFIEDQNIKREYNGNEKLSKTEENKIRDHILLYVRMHVVFSNYQYLAVESMTPAIRNLVEFNDHNVRSVINILNTFITNTMLSNDTTLGGVNFFVPRYDQNHPCENISKQSRYEGTMYSYGCDKIRLTNHAIFSTKNQLRFFTRVAVTIVNNNIKFGKYYGSGKIKTLLGENFCLPADACRIEEIYFKFESEMSDITKMSTRTKSANK